MNADNAIILRRRDAAATLQPLTVPAHDQHEFGALAARQRKEVTRWLAVLRGLRGGETRPAAAARLGVPLSTLGRKLKAFRAEGWRGLVPDWKNPASKLTPAFKDWWRNLADSNQRGSAAPYRVFCAMWRDREPVPGFDGHPGWPNLPRGCGYGNLMKLLDQRELVAVRVGKKAAAKFLPQTLTTRAGLWVGSHVMLDDMWGDFHVNVLEKKQAVRPLFLHALDVYSGALLEWGARPRLRDLAKEKHMGLLEGDTRLLLAAVLWKFGYHAERGTTIMAEHGTAAVNDRVEQVLHDYSGGKISVKRSGIVGAQQALAGLYEGDGKGNFKFKAALESLHNLIHNEQAFFPGQTGLDYDRTRPEHLHGLLTNNNALLQAACKLPAEKSAKLRWALLEWNQLMVANQLVMERVNNRTDHNLEGWLECGHIINEFRLDLQSDVWRPASALAALPEALQTALANLVDSGADGHTRARKLSPAEVRDAGRGALTRPSPALLAEILTDDRAVERKADGAYFEFEDAEAGLGRHCYEAVIVSEDGAEREARRGEKYKTFINPFDLAQMFMHDAAGRYLGYCRRVTRAGRADVEAIKEQWAANARREKKIFADLNIRKAQWSAAKLADRQHNNDLIAGTTPADREAARREQSLARRAQAAQAAANQQNQNNESEKVYANDEY